MLFVKHNKEAKKNGEEFQLPDEGVLQLRLENPPHTVLQGHVVLVGDRSTSSYAARSAVWILLRGL